MDYVLGIDGGGTNTVCIIADDRGNLLSKGVGGPSNYLVVGEGGAKQAVASAVKAALDKCSVNVSGFRVACLGMAGAGRPASCAVIERMMGELGIANRVLVESDAAIALAGATACSHGIVVIAGTGSMAFGMNRYGERRRAGGWGHILGDEGSGYDIGRKAMMAILRAHDGRGHKTMLLPKLTKHLKIATMDELIERAYVIGMERHEIAALAPLVVEATKEGDEVAKGILKEAGRELGLSAVAVIKGLRMENDEFDLAFIGGVFKAGELILDSFKESVRKIAPKCKVTPPRFEPAIGAVLLALKEINVKINEALLKSVKSTLINLQ